MSKIRAIVKRPDEPVGHVTNISNTLENFQRTVGGHIEKVTIAEDVVLLCNEEGAINGMPFNCRVLGMYLFGPIVLVGVDGEEFADLPADIKLKHWKGMIEGK